MKSQDIEKFERHLGKGKEIKLKNADGVEDTFYFKPLSVEALPGFMRLAQASQLTRAENEEISALKRDVKSRKIAQSIYESKRKAIEEGAGLRIMEGDNATQMVDLVIEMVNNSYPELKENTEVRNQFVFNNIMALTNVLMELNEGMTGDKETISQVEALKSKIIPSADETSK
jgi:hypothetical protein